MYIFMNIVFTALVRTVTQCMALFPPMTIFQLEIQITHINPHDIIVFSITTLAGTVLNTFIRSPVIKQPSSHKYFGNLSI